MWRSAIARQRAVHSWIPATQSLSLARANAASIRKSVLSTQGTGSNIKRPMANVSNPPSEGTHLQSNEQKQRTKDTETEDRMGWGRFSLYGISSVAGLTFLYYFWRSKYSLHKTELLLLERWMMLPFYPPPGPSTAELNAKVDPKCLPHDMVDALAEWFIATDLRELGGVSRDDILELFRDLGFDEDHSACKEFLNRGEGQLEERRRLSGVSLQESIDLLAKLAVAEGASPGSSPDHRLGREAVEQLKRRSRGLSSMLANASVLQQAMQAPMGFAPPAEAAPALTSATTTVTAATGGQVQSWPEERQAEEDIDDVEHSRMEKARLTRLEESLLAKLERVGTLSPAEESRLRDVREQLTAL